MADAQGSAPCERKLLGVQVPSLAPNFHERPPLAARLIRGTIQLGDGIAEVESLLPVCSGPWHLATSASLPPIADAISASERPHCCCSFTTLQSTWSLDIELQPEIPPASSNVPNAAAIPSFRNASLIDIPLASRIQYIPISPKHAHDIIKRSDFTSCVTAAVDWRGSPRLRGGGQDNMI